MAVKEAAMPDDSTPLGDAMTHRFPDQKIPTAPPLAGEVEDEDADPVIDSGPGIDDDVPDVDKERG